MNKAFIFFLTFLHVTLNAGDFYFERISSKDGLSQNIVLSIYQDSDGYMWFGTYNGLNRFDGYEFKSYTSQNYSNSISGNIILCITEDRNKNLWIGTLNRGLCKFNLTTEQFTCYKNTKEHPNLLTCNTVNNILGDSDNNIWIGTPKGLNKLIQNPDNSVSIQQFKNDPNKKSSLYDNEIQRVFEDSRKRIFISTKKSLELISTDIKNNNEPEFHHFLTSDKYYDIKNIIEINNGFLVSHHAGIVCLSFSHNYPDKYKSLDFKEHASAHIAMDFDGNIWSGGHNGLYRFEPSDKNGDTYNLTNHIVEGIEEYNLSNQTIRSLFIDNAGTLWIGTNGAGILKYNPQKTNFRHYKNLGYEGNISNNRINKIFEDKDGNIWFGTGGGGINLLSKDKEKNYSNGFISFPVNIPGEQNIVFDIIDISNTKSKTEIWAGVGYSSKLIEIKKENTTYRTSQLLPELTHQVMTMCKDELGTMWIGTYGGGLTKYNQELKYLKTFTTNNSLLTSDIILSIFEDSKKRLWIGTSEGILLITAQNRNSDSLNCTIFQSVLNDNNSLSNNYIGGILETSFNQIWISTYGGGINIYNEGNSLTNGHFTTIKVEDGLSSNTVKTIIEDNYGDFWITTNKGLSRYNIAGNIIRNFTMNDGLQDLEFPHLSGCKLHDGEILLGGVNGFNAFYPEEIHQDTAPPVVVLNELQITHKTIGIEHNKRDAILKRSLNSTKKIALNHKQNSFRINFAALQYNSPESNNYKYKLEGFDEDWVNTTSNLRYANYTNIGAGKYTFKVHASNIDGVWTRDPKILEIWITPPFWLTIWFRILITILLIIIIVSVVTFRFYLIKKQNQKLEKEVSVRLSEIKEKNKLLEEQAEALNETNTRLEERQQIVEEQSEELRAQKESLEEINATKDKFYSILAHDLRGPFSSLMGFLELIYTRFDKLNNEKKKKQLKTAFDSSKVLYQFVENLLQWSRAQRGIITYSPSPTKIKYEIDDIVILFAKQFHEKELDFQFNINDKSLEVNLDANMFKTIIRNLLSNAIKYSNKGGKISLDISGSNGELLVSVSDIGIGIPKEKIKSLFRIDNKFSSEGTFKEKGTGLGLVLCKEFIEKHKGNIWVESTENVGTTAFFTIPLS